MQILWGPVRDLGPHSCHLPGAERGVVLARKVRGQVPVTHLHCAEHPVTCGECVSFLWLREPVTPSPGSKQGELVPLRP